jgi:flagellar protein FlbD
LIEVTKLNKSLVIVNADLIEFVEKTPDTLITLTTGKKFMVRETLEDVMNRVLEYRSKTRSYPVPAAVGSPQGPKTAR